MLATTTFHVERMARAADSSTAGATDLAEWLVTQGTPFRDAHAIVGAVVREAVAGGDLVELVRAHPQLGPEAAAVLAPGVSVTRRTTPGGAGPIPFASQLERYRERVTQERFWLDSLT
jgi:argininosuccinate lyase